MPGWASPAGRPPAWLVTALALVATAAFVAALMPLRAHLSAATTALVLVLPVVGGVSAGGFGTGLVVTAACFLAYDYLFLPPYYTLYIAKVQDWVALGVYAIVMVLVARVVSDLRAARSESVDRARELRRLFDLSELLVKDLPGPELLQAVVDSVRSAFELSSATLLLPRQGELQVVASAGSPVLDQPAHEGGAVFAAGPGPVSMGPTPADPGNYQAVALVASGKAVGLLAVRGAPGSAAQQELLKAFANHLALTLERAGLREEALRARLLDEMEGLRRALVGAVSHDLRTPLATIKVSASTLVEAGAELSPDDARELAELVDAQADRLDRLVSNLLDMTRVQAGALVLRRQPVAVPELLEEAVLVLGRSARREDLRWRASRDLPPVDADPVLARQVLANLLDNAFRHSPPGAPVTVHAAEREDGRVEIRVSDSGPGVPAEDRSSVFQMFERREAGGRGGLGLAIAKAFVEAHGETIWMDPPTGQDAERGARFAFTLPRAEIG